jgi:hypothetical protein
MIRPQRIGNAPQLRRYPFRVFVTQKLKPFFSANALNALAGSRPQMQLAGVIRSVTGLAKVNPHSWDTQPDIGSVDLYSGLVRQPPGQKAAASRAAYRGRAIGVLKTQPAVDERIHVRRMYVWVAVCTERSMCLLISKDDEDVRLGRHVCINVVWVEVRSRYLIK